MGFKSTQEAAREAYRQAGVTQPSREVHVAEVHDCFTITELLTYEDLGFCEQGGARRLIEDGVTRLGGSLPVNPSGGLKSCGHPIGASGVRMIYEITLQLLHRAEERQAGEPTLGLAHNLGGPGAVACVTLLGTSNGSAVAVKRMKVAAPAPLPLEGAPVLAQGGPSATDRASDAASDAATDTATDTPTDTATDTATDTPTDTAPDPATTSTGEVPSGPRSGRDDRRRSPAGTESHKTAAAAASESASPSGSASAAASGIDAREFFETASSWLRDDAETAQQLVLRFDLSGHRGGTWTLVIENGEARLDPANPRSGAILMASVEDFEAILGGRISLQMAFMTGRFKIRGDMNSGMRIRSLFRLGDIQTVAPAPRDASPAAPGPLPQGLRSETSRNLGDVTKVLLPDVSTKFQPETSRFLQPGADADEDADAGGAVPAGDPLQSSRPPARESSAPDVQRLDAAAGTEPGVGAETEASANRPSTLAGRKRHDTIARKLSQVLDEDSAAAKRSTDHGESAAAAAGPDEIFALLSSRFDSDAAQAAGASVSYHIAITGPEQSDWSIGIQDGELTIEPGKPLAPDATLLLSADDWTALVHGQLSDKSAILTGRIKVRGSKPEAMLLKTYFRFGPPTRE
ncbi:MAG: SCP2 sterol-binding domain-containing protein [Candidatus Sericytochromatia bacterium]|uniref:acetyl-CoA C-acyltransferase n=1 Tax=Candidatus Tanganyikabacteria bacterium TaxID=2961651 RepID=A0A937X5S4_9BACT|nr:SCP2 sterol-binding domain-containing protein [Candidatus Tanganyikabacteria bacterium]